MSKQPTSDVRTSNAFIGHLVRRGVPVIVLLLVIVGAFIFWKRMDSAPRHESPPPPQDPIPVSIVTIATENAPVRMRFLGQTEASQVVELRARVAGYLQERSFKEGERVQAGQKLFTIDPRPLQVELAEARARHASGEATLARARQQLAKLKDLQARQASTQEEVDEAHTQERVAAADVELQKAQIAAAELQLTYTTIEAPITGRIGRALKDIGSYVDAGQNGLLAVIQQVDPMYVRYAVTEREILRFQKQLASRQISSPQVDQIELEITLADGSTYPHRGHINFIDVVVDETTGTSVVRGEVPNPPIQAPSAETSPTLSDSDQAGMLKPGQFIYANVLGIERIDVIRVPQRAVMQSPAGASVLVVNDQGVAQTQPISLGEWSGEESESGGDYWIVESGLKPGDRVITDRLMMVRPGMAVTVVSAQR